VVAGYVGAQVDDQVAEVVFLARADGTVGQEDEGTVADESAHRVVRVDPRVSSGGRVELRAWRPEFDGQDGVLMQGLGKAGGHHGSIPRRRAR
jgi:hypothetical protein